MASLMLFTPSVLLSLPLAKRGDLVQPTVLKRSGQFLAARMLALRNEKADALKQNENVECGRRADRSRPLVMRLDGRSFSKLTTGLARPYDIRLSQLMVATTAFLVQETQARLGYTQSDEISLFWNLHLKKDPNMQFLFDGKFQKLTSVAASIATAYFNRELAMRIPEKANELATFDCRVWNVKDSEEVYNTFLWRQNNAVENSVAMAAHVHFSHAELQQRSTFEKKEMLRIKGKPWEKELPIFKWGTFVGRVNKTVDLSSEQLARIPEKFRPSAPITRLTIGDLALGRLEEESRELLRSVFDYAPPIAALSKEFDSSSDGGGVSTN